MDLAGKAAPVTGASWGIGCAIAPGLARAGAGVATDSKGPAAPSNWVRGMKLYYATRNQGKVMSLQSELGKFGVTVVQAPLEIPEPRSSDVEEIAAAKAAYAFAKLKAPVVALDAGFYVDALNGFPRAYVNFVLETIGLPGLLALVDGKDRACEFRHSLAFMDGALKEPALFTDHLRGTMAPAPRGEKRDYHWSVLSLVFIPVQSVKTLSEMSFDEYQDWRAMDKNRNHYAKQFAEWFLIHKKNSA